MLLLYISLKCHRGYEALPFTPFTGYLFPRLLLKVRVVVALLWPIYVYRKPNSPPNPTPVVDQTFDIIDYEYLHG